MKKIITIFTLLLTVAFLAGCGKKVDQTKNENKATVASQEEQGGVISSIKDAMGLGKKMKCTYTVKTEEGTDTYITYVDGEKYKSESEFDGKMQLSVFDGEIIYSWNNKDKDGTKMSMKCLEDLNKPSENNNSDIPESIETPEESFDDATDVKCEDISSVDFTIPSDVVFKDQCEEMRKLIESLSNFKNQLPEQMPAGILPEGLPGQ